MKNTKKLPTKQLEKFSTIFMQLGFVLVLFVVYITLEHQTEVKSLGVIVNESSLNNRIYIPDEQEVIITRESIEIPKIEIPIPDVFIPDAPIDKGPLETNLFKEPKEEAPLIMNAADIMALPDPDPDPENDVPFTIIENVPVFPGCKGNKAALKKCFNQKMQKHFARKFDAELPNELGLSPGKKRLIMLFKIDKVGNIVDIRVKAPHPKLKKEATRIIQLLPTMKPGRQRGKPVGVKYTLPMRIEVE
jgi:protein TonB